jgi:hypothetical protein
MAEFLDWANANELYKYSIWFPFTGPYNNIAGTNDKGTSFKASGMPVGCANTVTLFNKVVLRSILGNIVSGFVGRFAGFTRYEIITAPTIAKKQAGILAQVDPYDSYSYAMGWDYCDAILQLGYLRPNSSKKFVPYEILRSTFHNALAKNPGALLEAREDGGVNDYSNCRECGVSVTTNVTFHGGLVPAVVPPIPISEGQARKLRDFYDVWRREHGLPPISWPSRNN